MKIGLIALLYSIAMSSSAFADSVGSAFMHSAGGGVIEVMPTVGFTNFTKKVNTAGAPFTEHNGSGMAEFLKAEYGINDSMSAGLLLGMYNYKSKSSPSGIIGDYTDSGMMDPTLFFNWKMGMGAAILRAGAMLAISPGDHKYSNDFSENAYSGAHSLNPWVGYEMNVGAGTVGTKLSYSMYLSDRKIHRDASAFYAAYDSKASGGQTTSLDVFYEHAFNTTFTLGVDLNWSGTQNTKEDVNGVTDDRDNGTASIGGAVYGTIMVSSSPTIFVVPFVQKNNLPGGTTAHVQSASVFLGGVRALFAF